MALLLRREANAKNFGHSRGVSIYFQSRVHYSWWCRISVSRTTFCQRWPTRKLEPSKLAAKLQSPMQRSRPMLTKMGSQCDNASVSALRNTNRLYLSSRKKVDFIRMSSLMQASSVGIQESKPAKKNKIILTSVENSQNQLRINRSSRSLARSVHY